MRHQDAQDTSSPLGPLLTADEYRLLADRLLGHLGADPIRDDSLSYLAQHLIRVAIQIEGETPSRLAERVGI
ncbi:hypothetical protein DESA109040_18845 [Deinococcus saxicola]